MSSLQKNSWIYLHVPENTKFPYYVSKPVMLNCNEFFVGRNYGLFKYNISDNEWTKWIVYGQYMKEPVICLNNDDKLIYVLDAYNGTLLRINYETNHIEVNKNVTTFRNGKCVQIFFAHQQLHVIGYCKSIGYSIHLIFDDSRNIFDVFHSFHQIFGHFELVHIPLKHIVLLIACDMIYSWSTTSYKWRKLKMESVLRYDPIFSCVGTMNGKYVILFPGNGNKIDIIDWRHMTIIHSNIRCPFKNTRAINIPKKKKKKK
eukprot:135402_1